MTFGIAFLLSSDFEEIEHITTASTEVQARDKLLKEIYILGTEDLDPNDEVDRQLRVFYEQVRVRWDRAEVLLQGENGTCTLHSATVTLSEGDVLSENVAPEK